MGLAGCLVMQSLSITRRELGGGINRGSNGVRTHRHIMSWGASPLRRAFLAHGLIPGPAGEEDTDGRENGEDNEGDEDEPEIADKLVAVLI